MLDDDADTWNVFREAIPHLVDLALRMPSLFPSASLDPLSIQRSRVTFSHAQIACINVHAFLGTLGMPEWNDWGGVNLYPHWFGAGVDTTRELRTSYIRITLAYFQQLDHYLQGEPVTFNLSTTAHGADANLDVPLVSLHIVELDEADDNPQVLSGLARYAQVVSAHRNIGFGPAATQEERVFASVPTLRVAPLFVPPLAADSALLISGGVRPLAHFRGHLRSARLVSIYATQPAEQSWLFMDAAELDAWIPPNDKDTLPDLHPRILQRELTKLLAGFSGLARGTDVVSIPWGCGAFGGDVRVKVLLLWIAASASGNVSRLHFTAPAGGLAVLQQLQSLSARTLWDVLHSDALRSAPSYWAALANANTALT
ncbi:hypothetical protein EXIGLDRAFT_721275 [Exidia glandulosa HHB12029]|uniref:poly(ADP-ribose) glycohydrolase n=1 Tax=Exidia glandulosa HHB12029 TaxID=1314781 RepID=A0A165NBE1_EXIGL|nr:hypothetical protein EXIGLDRAFT_721275 [Exidia glandulosa HHB12029]